jgi:hypothetical protein
MTDALTRRRLSLLGLDAGAVEAMPVRERVRAINRRFVEAIPYENLSALARRRAHPADPAAWPRGTDRLLEEARAHGLGGTCFSLAYALADVLRGVGANAHTALGRHLVKDEPHAAVIVFEDDGPYVFDPSYFLLDGIAVWPGSTLEDPVFGWELEPRGGAMLALVQCGRDGGRTPVFSMIPVPAPPDEFRRQWIDAVRRRPDRPGRIARRAGDEIRWFGEDVCRVDVLTCDGRREMHVDAQPVELLHELFGVAPDVLRSHFASLTAVG